MVFGQSIAIVRSFDPPISSLFVRRIAAMVRCELSELGDIEVISVGAF